MRPKIKAKPAIAANRHPLRRALLGGISLLPLAAGIALPTPATARPVNSGSATISSASGPWLETAPNWNLSITNTGSITSGTYGISNSAANGTLTNSGTISGNSSGISNNGGSIGTLTNSGTISGGYGDGIVNRRGSSIGTLINTQGGTISSNSWAGIYNADTIGTLTNNGVISGGSTGIRNDEGGTITTLTNSGTISGNSSGIYNNGGSIGTLTNSGTITGYYNGIDNFGSNNLQGVLLDLFSGVSPLASIATLINSGTITGHDTGIYNSDGAIGTLTNSGTISGGYEGIENYNASIATLTNSGAISGNNTGIYNDGGSITTLTNSGTISGGYEGIENYDGTIATLTNSSAISGNDTGIYNDEGSITTLTNSGTISGGSEGIGNYDGSIATLTNSGAISGNSYGIYNSYGSIEALTNSGTITAPTAIESTGGGLGPLTNTGLISGNINIASQNVTVYGASGGNFGTLTGGVFSVTSGDSIDFAGGNEFVNDAITGNVDIEQGTLADQGTITGNLTVAPAGHLLASGTVDGNVTIDGTYEADIAGTQPATATMALGANGYFSTLNVTGAGNNFVIDPGATLDLLATDPAALPRLTGAPLEIIQVADGTISGNFTNVVVTGAQNGIGIQYEEVDPPSSLSLIAIPSSAPSPFAAYAPNSNAHSAANVLDQILTQAATDPLNPAAVLSQPQIALIAQATSAGFTAQAPEFLQQLDGPIHAAMVATAPQAGQQLENSVFTRLSATAIAPATAPQFWTNVSTQFGTRGSDGVAAGFSSNVTQVVTGVDVLADGATRLGMGYAYTSSSVRADRGTGQTEENAGFIYGQLPVGPFVLGGIGGYGGTTASTRRADPLGGAELQTNGVGGSDALASVELSRPIPFAAVVLAPYGQLTWQRVAQASSGEGNASGAALSVDSFAGNGVRSVIGLTAGSVATAPLAAPYTYALNLGVGEDAGNLLNPSLHATLAGIGTSIASPNVSSTFVQASVSGTLRVLPDAYAYANLSGEARGNATLAAVAGGLRLKF